MTNGVDLSRFYPLRRDEGLVTQLGLEAPSPSVIPASPLCVIPAGKPESSAMDGKVAVSDGAGAERKPTVPGLGHGFPAGTTDKPLFVAGYIGTHGMAHALETVLEAARLTQQHPKGAHIRFVLLGDGARKQALKAQAAEMGLTNLHFLDSVPKAEVPSYWSLLSAVVSAVPATAGVATGAAAPLGEPGLDGAAMASGHDAGAGPVAVSESDP